MKKLCVMLILLLLALPLVSAELRIEEIKGYINNERNTDVDEDGGEFDVYPSDVVDLIVKLENTENTTTQAKLKGVIENIDNGDDLTKEQNWYDIQPEDDRSKTLSYSIPVEANVDSYDFELTIYYKFNNGTEENYRREYEVNLLKVEEEEDIVDMRDILGNLTTSCNSLAESTETCFSYVGRYDNCSDELSTVAEERGRYKQQAEDLQSTLDGKVTQLTECNRDKVNFENRLKEMVTETECVNRTFTAVAAAKRESDSKNNQLIGFVAIGGIVWWYWQNKKKKKSTVEGSYYYEKN